MRLTRETPSRSIGPLSKGLHARLSGSTSARNTYSTTLWLATGPPTSRIFRGLLRLASFRAEKSLLCGHGHPSESAVERRPSRSGHLAAFHTCLHVLPGPVAAEGNLSGAASRGRKPAGCLQAPHSAEERSRPAVHGRLPGAVGDPVEVSRGMAGLCPSGAAGHGHPGSTPTTQVVGMPSAGKSQLAGQRVK